MTSEQRWSPALRRASEIPASMTLPKLPKREREAKGQLQSVEDSDLPGRQRARMLVCSNYLNWTVSSVYARRASRDKCSELFDCICLYVLIFEQGPLLKPLSTVTSGNRAEGHRRSSVLEMITDRIAALAYLLGECFSNRVFDPSLPQIQEDCFSQFRHAVPDKRLG